MRPAKRRSITSGSETGKSGASANAAARTNSGGSPNDARTHGATGCKYNVAKKCGVPSICKIKPDGGCAGFEAKATPKKVDGD